ncbi:hypothetical protein [Polaribacter butkevichii]|uniref:Uncharacterized protein n=1 Tax=Polaribacter butkevichii TaxID=218490 RepID=A0A2P6CBN3_9FLAO|nr:hypothetical protein [Polaribacter butkevichii]PQJ72323.1 hypothetical protein BTO14_03250 [Polaribacter butkevichii]
MKKGLLIVLGMFLMTSTIEATNSKESATNIRYNYAYENAVNFEERGIEFFIFTNGEFDFNTQFNDSYYDYNGNRIRRESNIRIYRDYRGRIERIGNSSVNYDHYGNVTRIGNVFMRYHRGRLTEVGHLKIRYDAWGNPNFYGNVKDNYYSYNGLRINLNIGDIFDYNHAYFSHRDFSRNYSKIREDRNYYYYRANPNSKIGSRSKILRRRKSVASILHKKPTIRRNVTTYRRPSTVNTKRITSNGKRTNNTTYRRPSIVNKKNNTSTKRPSKVTKGRVISEKRNAKSSSTRNATTKRTIDKTKKEKRTTGNRRG